MRTTCRVCSQPVERDQLSARGKCVRCAEALIALAAIQVAQRDGVLYELRLVRTIERAQRDLVAYRLKRQAA